MPPDDGELADAGELQREIERLKADLDFERRRAAENETRADNLDQQVSRSGQQLHSAQVAQLTAQENAATDAINATAQELATLKAQLANLQAEGKFEEAADVQERIGDAAARRQQAMQAKTYFTRQKELHSSTPPDPVERFLTQNQGQYANEDIAWIRSHHRYATDLGFRNRVIQAHAQALEQGINQRTPEYYKFLEDAGYMRAAPPASQEQGAAPTGEAGDLEPEIRIREERGMPQDIDGEPEAYGRRPDRPQQRAAGNGSLRAAIAGAPSRRSVNATGRRTIVELTPDERDTALAVAPHMADAETLAGGQPAILRWWHELKYSPAAERIRREWADRR